MRCTSEFFCQNKNSNKRLARPAGVEPATVGFEVHYSIQLSYGRNAASLYLCAKECQTISQNNKKAIAKIPFTEYNLTRRRLLCGGPAEKENLLYQRNQFQNTF